MNLKGIGAKYAEGFGRSTSELPGHQAFGFKHTCEFHESPQEENSRPVARYGVAAGTRGLERYCHRPSLSEVPMLEFIGRSGNTGQSLDTLPDPLGQSGAQSNEQNRKIISGDDKFIA